MANYLDNLSEYTSKTIVVQAALAKEMRLLIEAGNDSFPQMEEIVWYEQLLQGANDTNQTDELRLRLLTILVDNARLNEVPLTNVFGLYQTLSDTVISASQWGLIGGNINDQLDLQAQFNTYLPLSAGTTKPLTGALYFGSDGLGIDVLTETDTLNIGASAGVVQFGADAEVKLWNITEGTWLATNIGVAHGGLGDLDFAGGTDGQAVVKSGAGYAFYTIPAIPDLTGYVKADGTVPMTADLRFPISKGIDTAAAGTLYIGQNNATAVQIFQNLSVTNIVSGNWQASPVDLEFGGTGAVLAPPSNPSFFIYDSGSAFAEIGANLVLTGGAVTLAEELTGIKWHGTVIETAYGGTGLSTVGAEGEVFTIVSGAPAWAAFSALTNPMTTAGDIIYGGVAGAPTRLAANATATNKFFRSVSSGDPSWETLLAADIPNIAITQVTGLTTALSNKLATTLASGKMFVGNGSGAAAPVLMSGDATLSNTGSLTIANSAITFAKMQNASVQYALIGRWSAGAGVFQEVTIDGTTIVIDAFGVMSSTGGGGGTPGGSDTQLQYNSAGSFGGITGATTNGTFVTLTTPVLGIASATSINKVAITTPATGSTLTIADGKTLTASNTLTFTGTDASSVAFGAGGTVAYVGLANTWTSGIKQTFAPSATDAGINVGTLAGQPSSPANGDLVYNSSATALQAYINGSWVSLGAGGGGGVTTMAAIGSSANANGATISGATLNLEPASASFGGVVTTGTQTLAGAKTFSGAMTINPTASLTTAQLTFGSLINNWISFSTVGNAVPALTTRSVGTKIVLYASLSGAALDYAIGTGVSTMWLSLGSSGDIFHIYAPISSVVTSIFSINPTTSIAYNGSAMTYGTNTTSTNVTGSAATGIFSRNFINLGTGGGTAGPVTVGSSFSSRSLGTRLIIQSASATSDADMAIGYTTNTFWQSVITSSYSFAWYAGAGSTGGTAATHLMNLSGTGVLNLVQSAGRLQIAGTQVVGPRDTGWTAFTGATNEATSYDTATVLLSQLAERVAAIQAALTTHGLIGA